MTEYVTVGLSETTKLHGVKPYKPAIFILKSHADILIFTAFLPAEVSGKTISLPIGYGYISGDKESVA
jgi:hypothetical protein